MIEYLYMPSPKPNTEKDLKVLALRATKPTPTFRDIANRDDIKEDVKNVHMRYKRALKLVGKLQH